MRRGRSLGPAVRPYVESVGHPNDIFIHAASETQIAGSIGRILGIGRAGIAHRFRLPPLIRASLPLRYVHVRSGAKGDRPWGHSDWPYGCAAGALVGHSIGHVESTSEGETSARRGGRNKGGGVTEIPRCAGGLRPVVQRACDNRLSQGEDGVVSPVACLWFDPVGCGGDPDLVIGYVQLATTNRGYNDVSWPRTTGDYGHSSESHRRLSDGAPTTGISVTRDGRPSR